MSIPEPDLEPDEPESMCECGGEYDEHNDSRTCPNGKCYDGRVYLNDDPGDDSTAACPVCHGTGVMPACNHCSTCKGFTPRDRKDDGDAAFDAKRDKEKTNL